MFVKSSAPGKALLAARQREIHSQVQCFLRGSVAFRSLDAKRRAMVQDGTETLLTALTRSELADGVRDVSFPSFVAGLIRGVFHAIVDASIKQMEEYADLVGDVAKTLEEFSRDNVESASIRKWLCERIEQRSRNHSKSRQQLLATTVLMGINRIIVTEGRIHAKVCFSLARRKARECGCFSATSRGKARGRSGPSRLRGNARSRRCHSVLRPVLRRVTTDRLG